MTVTVRFSLVSRTLKIGNKNCSMQPLTGAKSDEIVEALIANSATFDKKTAFSQEKYRIKKQKKYALRVLLTCPFARRQSMASILAKLFPKEGKSGHVVSSAVYGQLTANSDVLVADMFCNLFGRLICKGSDVFICGMEDISLSSENVVSDIVHETTLYHASKFCKAPKAGEKASLEALKLWKELVKYSPTDCQGPELLNKNLVEGNILLCCYSLNFVFGPASVKKVLETIKSLGAAGFVLAVESVSPGTKFDHVPVVIPGVLITDVTKPMDLIDYYNISTSRDWTESMKSCKATVELAMV
ncbi:hypothetical protein Ddye_007237 [Dipteronia dyeriana]|uniref:tRNA (adenine(58)-N(1))-methyltransferase non-catalytic subunit TRM6 n=1 Tax=Dipteronia dyeriana TaxID=168575 RepID=A0AAD9XJJ6_9ROSI|nr:hypothetical protein Ddye_007237 [Dipteronia dyeriana]